jgi:hypothetical protein
VDQNKYTMLFPHQTSYVNDSFVCWGRTLISINIDRNNTIKTTITRLQNFSKNDQIVTLIYNFITQYFFTTL